VPTITNAVVAMEDIGVLKELTRKVRNRLFAYAQSI